MHLLWRRYSRSGYASPAFYVAMVAAFAGLAIWAAVRADWLVAAMALAMAAMTVAGARVMRRLARAERATKGPLDEREGEDDG